MSTPVIRAPARSHRLGASLLPLVALALLGPVRLANAQTFTGTSPVRPLAIPGAAVPPPVGAAPVAPARTEAVPPSGTDAAQPGTTPHAITSPRGDRLLRLPASASGWRIAGEAGELSWPLYLTPDESRVATRFRLTYRTDISALPDGSSVVLSVNGAALGSVGGQAARPRGAVFDVPPGLLQPGFNAVTLRSKQHHRVDCSLPATYELWTELDPGGTGLVVAAESAGSILALTDLQGLPVRPDGALAIRIVVEGRLQPKDVERAMRAAAALAVASRTLHPVVDFGPPSVEEAINLIVGRDAAVEGARAKLAPARALAPGLAISPASPERAATLIVSGVSDQDVEAAISALARRPALSGSPAGRQQVGLSYGPKAAGGEIIPFTAFGLGPISFEGRRLTVQIPLALPADFLPADYDQVALNLTGEYGAGLGPAAEILVRVNDRDAASWPMAKAAGASVVGQPIGLPLSLFRPGPNRIEITALLPGTDEGTACPGERGGRGRGHFTLSEQSSLRVPALARIGRSPELATAAAGGFSHGQARTLRLIVPQPDRESLAAAATLAAKFATTQGRVPDIALSRDGRMVASGDTLVVAPAQVLDRGMLEIVGADGTAMQSAWRARVDEVARSRSEPLTTGSAGERRRGGPSACSGETLRPGRPAPGSRPIAGTQPEIVDEPRPEDPERGRETGWSTRLLGLGQRLETLVRGPLDRAEGLLRARAPHRVAPEADDIAMFAQGRSDGGQFFVMTAPSALDLKFAAECLVSPQAWSEMAGRAVLIRATDGAIRSVAADDLAYVQTQAPTLRNVRLIAAGLLSLNPGSFVVLALLLAAALTLATRALVRNVGRRQA